MRTVELKVYRYSELSEKAKEKVKNWYMKLPERGCEFDFDIEQELEEKFPNSYLKYQYSLNSCQGDGFNTYGTLNMEDALKNIDLIVKEKMKEYIDICELGISIPMNTRYTYSKANDISFADDMIDYLIDNGYENIDKELIYKFEKKTKEMIETFDKKKEKEGYDFFYNVSEEDLNEFCNENDYEFYEDGTMF